MIIEDYVSYNVARLLKEKGFEGDCDHFFNIATKEIEAITKRNWYNMNYFIPAPTHQMAMKWLREVHNILILPRWVYNNGNTEIVYGYTIFQVFPLPYRDYSNENIWYVSYEETIESALKYALENLI